MEKNWEHLKILQFLVCEAIKHLTTGDGGLLFCLILKLIKKLNYYVGLGLIEKIKIIQK